MRGKGYLNVAVLAFVNLVWASQYPAYKIASSYMTAGALNVWTLALAILLLAPFLLLRRPHSPSMARRKPFPQTVRQFLLLGLLGIVPPSVVITWGIERTTASNAALLSLTIPVLMVMLSVVMLGERVTWLRFLSLVLALLGTVLASKTQWTGALFDSRLLLGNVLVFASGGGSAFYNTYSKKLLERYSELQVLVCSYAVGCLGSAAISLIADDRPFYRMAGYPLSAWLAVAALGALPWGLGMVLWLWVLKRLDASQASVSVYLLPVFGVLLSAITLKEKLSVPQLAGGSLAVLGLLLASVYDTRSGARIQHCGSRKWRL